MHTSSIADKPVRWPWHAPVVARWLGLAASPAFAFLAWTSAVHPAPAALCAAAPGGPLGGMTAMYALMSLFHLAPWLNLSSRHCP